MSTRCGHCFSRHVHNYNARKIDQTKIHEDAKTIEEVPETCNMMHCTNFADMFSKKNQRTFPILESDVTQRSKNYWAVRSSRNSAPCSRGENINQERRPGEIPEVDPSSNPSDHTGKTRQKFQTARLPSMVTWLELRALGLHYSMLHIA